MITVRILYFALLREQRGVSDELLETGASTARGLYAELSGRYAFSLAPERLRVIVNDAFAEWDTALADGDSIGFIPPVAGG